jgi:nicotinamide phosphoribosyltransferase
MTTNLIAMVDSYKLSQHKMYVDGTETVYSYFEARKGAEFDKTVFFGLQRILFDHLDGDRITKAHIDSAGEVFDFHMGPGVFNEVGWDQIVRQYNGSIPLRIWAVPEGSVHDASEVLMVVENTGGTPFRWLTDYIETLMVQVWYASTVASLSRAIKGDIADYMMETTGSTDGIDFMLHDFGCRGATGMEAAGTGGMAHLINFKGTDTVPALFDAISYYGADPESLGFSVAAAQHSIMTQLGETGEAEVVETLLDRFPEGILAAPIDSYNYINYVDVIAVNLKDKIMARDGKFVFRPDSTSEFHPTPEEEMVWLLGRLWDIFGGTVNEQGYKVIDSHVGALWGDGIDREGINKIMEATTQAGFAVTNYLFGMGGALLQKVNRDTQQFAFKCSAMRRNGEWVDIQKNPLDKTKASKTGRFDNLNLPLVFENGEIMKAYTFDEVRENAKL